MTQALIARLEAAGAGSRELDALIWAHFHSEVIKITGWNMPYGDASGRTQVEFTLPPKRTRRVTDARGSFVHAEPVTTSLDAAMSLAVRVLGEKAAMYALSDIIADEGRSTDLDNIGLQDLPRLACAAILRAKELT